MRYTKGQSGNPNGRPKGATNKATDRLRSWVTSFLEDNLDQIKKDFHLLEPKDRLILFERLLKYSLPTLQSTAITSEFDAMTDEELDRIITELKRA